MSFFGGYMWVRSTDNPDISFVFNVGEPLESNQHHTSSHFPLNLFVNQNFRPETSGDVRLEPLKKWGTDWGTTPLKVGYGPNSCLGGDEWR
jgi:hypothetical protein